MSIMMSNGHKATPFCWCRTHVASFRYEGTLSGCTGSAHWWCTSTQRSLTSSLVNPDSRKHLPAADCSIRDIYHSNTLSATWHAGSQYTCMTGRQPEKQGATAVTRHSNTLPEAEQLLSVVRILHLALKDQEGLRQSIPKLATAKRGPGHDSLPLHNQNQRAQHTQQRLAVCLWGHLVTLIYSVHAGRNLAHADCNFKILPLMSMECDGANICAAL